jgi:hypothetical protein
MKGLKMELKFLAAAILMVFFVTQTYPLVSKMKTRAMYVMFLIGCTYPLGKLIQGWLEVPSVIRWHLADVGWTSFVALILLASNIIRFDSYIKSVAVSIFAAGALGVAIELFQLVFYPKLTSSGVLVHVAGDWNDVLVFVVMTTINLLLLAMFVFEKSKQYKSLE